MIQRLSLFGMVLTAGLLFGGNSGTPTTPEKSLAEKDDEALRVANPIIEQENIRVQILEIARAFSPGRDHAVTSLLFMIEHSGAGRIKSHQVRSPLKFSNDRGETIALPVSECPKTGDSTYDFKSFSPPWHVQMPKPVDPSRTFIVRQWFCHEIPHQAASIDAAFGIENDLKEFRFILERR